MSKMELFIGQFICYHNPERSRTMDINDFIKFIVNADEDAIRQIEDFLAKFGKQSDPLETDVHTDCKIQELL